MWFADAGRHRQRRWSAVWLAGLGVLLLTGTVQATDPSIARVEEDWELVVGEPDWENNAPQVFIVTTPTGNIDGQHSVFEINNLSLPDYYGGGLQLQTWSGEDNTDMEYHSSLASLNTANETITFTVQLRLRDNLLRFRVKDGTSQTWGAFGGESLSITQWSSLTDLTGYDPEKSAELSRVGFAGNRVQRLELKRVRYYTYSEGIYNLVETNELSRVVHDGSVLGDQ